MVKLTGPHDCQIATFDVVDRLRGKLFRSLTTNGLLLEGEIFERLIEARPDKIHVSVHFHGDVERVVAQVHRLAAYGIKSGINLLVSRSQLETVRRDAAAIRAAGIDNARIVYLPMRIRDTPSPAEVAEVAGGARFQSMTCLGECAKSPRFCSIAWDKTVAWCSYTTSRKALSTLTYDGLLDSLDGLGLTFCGGDDDGKPVRLSRRSLHGHDLVRGGP